MYLGGQGRGRMKPLFSKMWEFLVVRSQKQGQLIWSDCPVAFIFLLVLFYVALGSSPFEGANKVVMVIEISLRASTFFIIANILWILYNLVLFSAANGIFPRYLDLLHYFWVLFFPNTLEHYGGSL